MDKCKHGFDHACLICGFTHIDGKKVWFDWAWQEQQKVIDKKHEAIESLSIAFKKMQDDSKDKQKQIDEQQARLDNVKQLVQKWRDNPACYSELNVWECSARIIQALKGDEV